MTEPSYQKIEPLRPLERPAPERRNARASTSWLSRVLLFAVMVVVPTLVAGVYYLLVAAPIYVSEASFLVRTANAQPSVGLTSVLQGVGFSPGATDAYAVHEFILSRDAVRQLTQGQNLRAVLGRPGADFLARFPRPFEGSSNEHLFEAYRRFVSVGYDPSTGVSTLHVETFRPKDSQAIAEALLEGSERVVNQLNAQAEHDAVEQARAEVLDSQTRIAASENALTSFRSRERLIDPSRSSAADQELISRLSEQLASLRAERSGLAASAPQSPQLPALDNRIRAYQREIEAIQTRVAGQTNSLAPKIGQYERLVLERDFAGHTLTSAMSALETAQQEARRKRLYLQRVVNPSLPDAPMLPHRWRGIGVVFITALMAYGVLVLVMAGLREHRQ
ncbi:MAG TPA: chain-length determining protein [Caulobacteraceae bacterium]|nr:chain-length determining protein [Caulobacteraceae bacterium]